MERRRREGGGGGGGPPLLVGEVPRGGVRCGELALLLEIYGVVFDVQEHTSVRFLAALICVKLAHRHSSDVVLVQVGATFPARFANALEEVFADFAFAIAL